MPSKKSKKDVGLTIKFNPSDLTGNFVVDEFVGREGAVSRLMTSLVKNHKCVVLRISKRTKFVPRPKELDGATISKVRVSGTKAGKVTSVTLTLRSGKQIVVRISSVECD